MSIGRNYPYYIYWIFLFQIKWEVKNSYIKIAERGTIDTLIHDHSLFWFSTCTSINRTVACLNYFYGPKIPLLLRHNTSMSRSLKKNGLGADGQNMVNKWYFISNPFSIYYKTKSNEFHCFVWYSGQFLWKILEKD